MNRAHTTDELIIGTLALTLLIPLIYINTTSALVILSSEDFFWIMAIWWLVSGFTSQLILYVQFVRRKLRLELYALSWLIFIITLIPVYYFQLLPIVTLAVLIEPTFFILKLQLTKPKLPKKPKFKQIGRLLTVRLILYVILLGIVVYV
jgi:hypothetical protein